MSALSTVFFFFDEASVLTKCQTVWDYSQQICASRPNGECNILQSCPGSTFNAGSTHETGTARHLCIVSFER